MLNLEVDWVELLTNQTSHDVSTLEHLTKLSPKPVGIKWEIFGQGKSLSDFFFFYYLEPDKTPAVAALMLISLAAATL